MPGGQAGPLPPGLAFEGTTSSPPACAMPATQHMAAAPLVGDRGWGQAGGPSGSLPLCLASRGLGNRSARSVPVSMGRARPRESLLSHRGCMQLEARLEKCTWLVSVTFQLWPVGVD